MTSFTANAIAYLESITAFSDPSVNFGLQLKDAEDAVGSNGNDVSDVADEQTASIEVTVEAEVKSDDDPEAEAAPKTRKRKKKKGEIIALDAFRKK